MTVARITEISAESTRNFDDAVKQGIKRANSTLRNVRGAWIKEQQVVVENERVVTYRVNMLVTFVLEDSGPAARNAVGAAAPVTKAAPAKKAPAKKAAKRRPARRRR